MHLNVAVALEPLPNYAPQFNEDQQDIPGLNHPMYADPLLTPFTGDDNMIEILENYWHFYRTRFQTSSPVVHNYTFRTVGTDVAGFLVPDFLTFIYQNVSNVFTFNLGTTTLLRQDIGGGQRQYMVFIAQTNRQNVFPRALFVHNLETLNDARQKLESLHDVLMEPIERNDTSWKFVAHLGLT